MTKLIKIIRIFLVCISILCANMAFAAQNSILNTSLRQTSSDSVNITFFTKADSADAPIVKNKGNNQYVILLPNTSDAAGRTPDLRNVSNLVSDVNVKTINEGAVTYTKVTLTSKRPINIKADTRRTSQSASELSGVNDIVARVNLINQDIQSSKNIAPQPAVYQASSTQSMPKLNSVQDILNNKNLIGTQKTAQKPETKPVLAPVSKNTVSAHVPADLKTVKKESAKVKSEDIKNIRNEAVKNIDKMEENVKTAVANEVYVNEEEPAELAVSLEPIQEESPVPEALPQTSKFSLGSPIILIALLIFGGLLFALFLFNKIRATLLASDDISSSFIERMNSSITSNKKDFSSLASNQNLNWQQKYANFKKGKTEEQQEELSAHIGAVHDEDLDIVEEDDYALQNYTEPVEEEVEVLPLMKDTPNPFAAAVQGSGDVIAHSMKRSLKSFADDRSLYQTRRNSGIKGRFRSFDTTPVEGLSRNLNALLDTVVEMEEEKGPVSAVSSAIERPAEVTPQELVQRVAEKSAVQNNATSPIERAQAPAAKKKMKIKESRAIDENKGFYLVDMDDKLALMGRINDKFTVLKKFDDKEKTTLQVRRDKDNLYMVRTDGFKALVDVKEDKMGVLAEL